MVSAALVDTGPLVAMFAADEPQGAHYSALIRIAMDEHWALATSWACVVEASHLVRPPHRYALLRWIAAGSITVYPLEVESLEATVGLMKRWTEPPRTEMDLADAALLHLATELDIDRIMTMDRRDFSRYRLPDGRSFEIL